MFLIMSLIMSLVMSFFSMTPLFAVIEKPSFIVTIDKQQNLLDSLEFMRYIARLSNDSILLMNLDTMPTDNVIQKYSQLCCMVHRSFMHIKNIYLSCDDSKMQNFLYRKDITMNALLAMQRNNRLYIKNMINELKNIPNSDDLQVALHELYHNLHEVKKQIIYSHQNYMMHAQYMYGLLLFLSMILAQGTQEIKVMNCNVDQQIMMQQLFYCIEKIKQSIISDFVNKKGVL